MLASEMRGTDRSMDALFNYLLILVLLLFDVVDGVLAHVGGSRPFPAHLTDKTTAAAEPVYSQFNEPPGFIYDQVACSRIIPGMAVMRCDG